MKAILISIQSPHTCNILNLIKLCEIRKKFPSDYVGWVYIYCTKGGQNLFRKWNGHGDTYYCGNEPIGSCIWYRGNGKVVARFWCDKVETIFAKPDRYKEFYFYDTSKLDMEDLLKQSCLEYDELNYYLDANDGYAIHITKLEIFDKPKEIGEFYTTRLDQDITKRFDNSIQLENGTWVKPLTRAPQSWQFIEVDL